MSARCSNCEALEAELSCARGRVGELEAELEKVRGQLREALKLVELQKAEIGRYKQIVRGHPQPNQPERAHRDQIQFAFDQVLAAADPAIAAKVRESDLEAKRARENQNAESRGHGRRKLDLSGLPVIEDRITPEEVLRDEKKGWKLIKATPTERVAFRPACYVRIRTIVETWVRVEQAPAQEARPAVEIITAPLPDYAWPHVMGDPSVIADVILSKYDYLVPLHRQERWTRNRGFVIPRSTQSDWISAAFDYAKHITEAMHAESVASARCVATDATGAPVRAPGKCRHWHVFTFISDAGHVTFRHSRHHSSRAIGSMLDGFQGSLLADASSIYDALFRRGVVAVACWAHLRRYVWRAVETERARAYEGLALIGRLFEVARDAKEISMPERTAWRAERAAPVLEIFDAWISRIRDDVEPRGRLAAAVTYYTNQRTALRRFLDDGELPIDNNVSERELRHLVGGRDNWKHFENEAGLAWYTTFRSLIASCGMHRLNPHEYLEPVLRLLPHWPKSRALELSPKYWLDTVAKLDERERAIIHPRWCAPAALVEEDAAA